MWDKEWVWSRTFSENLLRDATQRRLEELAFAAQFESADQPTQYAPLRIRRVAIWIGKRLVTLGNQLQRQFSDVQESSLQQCEP